MDINIVLSYYKYFGHGAVVAVAIGSKNIIDSGCNFLAALCAAIPDGLASESLCGEDGMP